MSPCQNVCMSDRDSIHLMWVKPTPHVESDISDRCVWQHQLSQCPAIHGSIDRHHKDMGWISAASLISWWLARTLADCLVFFHSWTGVSEIAWSFLIQGTTGRVQTNGIFGIVLLGDIWVCSTSVAHCCGGMIMWENFKDADRNWYWYSTKKSFNLTEWGWMQCWTVLGIPSFATWLWQCYPTILLGDLNLVFCLLDQVFLPRLKRPVYW